MGRGRTAASTKGNASTDGGVAARRAAKDRLAAERLRRRSEAAMATNGGPLMQLATRASESDSAARSLARFGAYVRKHGQKSDVDEEALEKALEDLAGDGRGAGAPQDVRAAALAEYRKRIAPAAAGHGNGTAPDDDKHGFGKALAAFKVTGGAMRAPVAQAQLEAVFAAYGREMCFAVKAPAQTSSGQLSAMHVWRRRVCTAVQKEAREAMSEWEGEARRAHASRKAAAAAAPPACSPFYKNWRELAAFSAKWRLTRVARLRIERLKNAFHREAEAAVRDSGGDPWITRMENIIDAEQHLTWQMCVSLATNDAPRLIRLCADVLAECRIARATSDDAAQVLLGLSAAHETSRKKAIACVSEKVSPTTGRKYQIVDWAALDRAVGDATEAVREFLAARGATDGLLLPAEEVAHAGGASGAVVFFGAAARLRIFPGSVGGVPVTRLASRGVDLPEVTVGGDACVQLAAIDSAEGGYAVLTHGTDEPTLTPLCDLPGDFVKETEGDDARIIAEQTGRSEVLLKNLTDIDAKLEAGADAEGGSDGDVGADAMRACLLRALVEVAFEPAYARMLAEDEAALLGESAPVVDKSEAKRQALARQLEREEEARKEVERRKEEKRRQAAAAAASADYAAAEKAQAEKEALEAARAKAEAEAEAAERAAAKKAAAERAANDRAMAAAKSKAVTPPAKTKGADASTTARGGAVAAANGPTNGPTTNKPASSSGNHSAPTNAAAPTPGKRERAQRSPAQAVASAAGGADEWRTTGARRVNKAPNGKATAPDALTGPAAPPAKSKKAPANATAAVPAAAAQRARDEESARPTEPGAAPRRPTSGRERASADDAPSGGRGASQGRGGTTRGGGDATPEAARPPSGHPPKVSMSTADERAQGAPPSAPSAAARPSVQATKPLQRSVSMGTKLRTELDVARASAAAAWSALESAEASGGAQQRVLLLEALSWDAQVNALAAEVQAVVLGAPGSRNDPAAVAAARGKAEELRGVAHAKQEAATRAAEALSAPSGGAGGKAPKAKAPKAQPPQLGAPTSAASSAAPPALQFGTVDLEAWGLGDR